MAEWKGTGSDVRYFWESLWALGVDEQALRGIDLGKYGAFTAKGKRFEDFVRNELAPLGITPEVIGTAKRMAVWRADTGKEPTTRISSYLKDVLGWTDRQVGEFQNQVIAGQSGPGGRLSSPGQKNQADEGAMLTALKGILPPQAFTQMAIKTGLAPKWKNTPVMEGLPVWNPLRTDQPGGVKQTAPKPGESPADLLARAGVGFATNIGKPGPPGGGGPGNVPDQTQTPPGPVTPTGDTGLPAPKPKTPAEIKAEIEASYGWAAGLADIPEIAKILNDVYNGRISIGEADNLFKGSQYYKTTTAAERTWKSFQKTDPAEAKVQWQQQYNNLGVKLRGLGIPEGTVRLDTLTDLSLRFGWSEQQVNSFIASEMKYDPDGMKKGVFKQVDDLQRDYLVPLSENAKTAWGQALVSGNKTIEDYEAYLRTNAISMFPALANALEDPEMTVRQYLDPYNQVISKTLGVNEADIDWEDAKFSRFINTIDPKTNARTIMSIADVQRVLRTDKQYGWADTAAGKSEKAGLARTILEDFGLRPESRSSFSY
jgi:hypothetical protein